MNYSKSSNKPNLKKGPLQSSPPAPPVASQTYNFEQDFQLPRFKKSNHAIQMPVPAAQALTAKDRVEAMVNSNLGAQKQSILQPKKVDKANVVQRVDNREFMSDFNNIFYGREKVLPNREEPQKTLKEKLQPHGMEVINFTLTEHILESKIQNAAEDALAKTEAKMANEMAKKTKDLRKYMDEQFKKSQIAISGMQHDINSTNVNMLRQSQDLQKFNQYGSGSYENQARAAESQKVEVPIQINGESYILELDNIVNFEVIDLNNQQSSSKGNNNNASIFEQLNNDQPDQNGLTDEDKTFFTNIFEQFSAAQEPKGPDYVAKKKERAPINNFDKQFPDEVEAQEALQAQPKQRAVKSIEQLQKERYAKMLEDEQKQAELNALGDKERMKALDCMFKIMNHQLDHIKNETREVTQLQNQHTQGLQEMDDQLNKKEYEIFKKYHEDRLRRKKLEIEQGVYFQGDELLENIDDIDEEELEAHGELRDYADAIKKRIEKNKLIDCGEVVVQNKMLINQIDEILGQNHTADTGPAYADLSISASTKLPMFTEETDDTKTELDDSQIDKLFTDLVGAPTAGSTNRGLGKKTVQSKKTKYARPATVKAPVVTITDIGSKAKSRLFDYKEKHDDIKNKSLQQIKKEAQDKRMEFQTKLRASAAQEKRELGPAERLTQMNDFKIEKNIRQEIGSAMKKLKSVQAVAFQSGQQQ